MLSICLISTLFLTQYVSGDFNYADCRAEVLNGTFGTLGTTDRDGDLVTNLSLVEGYQYEYCAKNCGSGIDYHSYKTFAEQSTLWFLPWFLLVAQIPCFTQSKAGDFVVMLLSIGSPTTALYSLFLTIFDRKWLTSFGALISSKGLGDTVHNVCEVLYSLHQFPIEVEDLGFLAYTFREKAWWTRLRKWFVGRRRHMEASAYAQLLLTVVVYCFAVLPDAFSDLGDNTTAHGLAIGNIWMWLIPLVWGYYSIGTHHGRRRQVKEKLHEMSEHIRRTEKNGREESVILISDPHSRSSSNAVGWFENEDRKIRKSLLGFSILGDRLSDGPFYNYARCSSWSNLCVQILSVYADVESVRLKTFANTYQESASQSEQNLISGVEVYTHLGVNPISENYADSSQGAHLRYRNLKDSVGRTIRFKKAQAFFIALVVQGVFGWSAFMIDYTTPPLGIGCRAFLCMAYTLISGISCLLLIIASQCTDSWMAKFDRSDLNVGIGDEGVSSKARHELSHHALAVTAVFCRLLGKILAVFNAIFIIIGCGLEFVGVYENCFCKSSYIGLQGKAYVSLLSTEQCAEIARPFWYGGSGVAMATVLILGFGYFARVHKAKY